MMGKKLKIVLALGAMAAVFGAAGCGGGSSKSAASASKNGIPSVIRVGSETTFPPFEFTKDDKYVGFDIDLADAVIKQMGSKMEFKSMGFDALIPAVQSGTVDCVIAGQSITADRMQQVDFTEPYFYATIVTLTKSDSQYASAASVADLSGATATSQMNTIWYNNCLPQIPDANILPAQADAPAMLVALNSGTCDIVVTDKPTGLAACVAYPDFTMLDFTGTEGEFEVSDEDINIGISLKKGNTELKEKLDSVLSTMTEEDFTELMDQAISVQPLSK